MQALPVTDRHRLDSYVPCGHQQCLNIDTPHKYILVYDEISYCSHNNNGILTKNKKIREQAYVATTHHGPPRAANNLITVPYLYNSSTNFVSLDGLVLLA